MIIVITENPRKLAELRRIFARYNIQLRQVLRRDFDEAMLPEWFAKERRLQAVLDETSRLTRAARSSSAGGRSLARSCSPAAA